MIAVPSRGGGVRGPPPYNLPAAHLQKIKITKFRCEYLASRTPPPHPIAPPPHHPDCSGRSSFHCRRGGTQKKERKKERGVKNPRWLLRLVDGPLLRSFSFSSPFSFSSTSSRFFIIIFFFVASCARFPGRPSPFLGGYRLRMAAPPPLPLRSTAISYL